MGSQDDNVIELKRAGHFTPDDLQELFLIALGEMDGNITRACDLCQITRGEFNQWCEVSQGFVEGLEEVADRILDNAEQVLQDAINDNNLTATIFFLKCKGKSRGYVERQEVTGTGGKPLTFEMNFIAAPKQIEGE